MTSAEDPQPCRSSWCWTPSRAGRSCAAPSVTGRSCSRSQHERAAACAPEEEGDETKKTNSKIVDRTSEYTVIEETTSDGIELDPKPNDLADDPRLEISEWDEEDEDMMES